MSQIPGVLDEELEAIGGRLLSGELTEADLQRMNEVGPRIADAIREMFNDVYALMTGFAGGTDSVIAPQPWPRPRPGAELGGRPRNPEDDVLDDIDELVDWQMRERR